jgi:hypothetical protein
MATGILSEDEVEFLVLVKTDFAGQEISLQFEFGEGQRMNIRHLRVKLSETQAQRLGNLTTNYVGNVAEVLFNKAN